MRIKISAFFIIPIVSLSSILAGCSLLDMHPAPAPAPVAVVEENQDNPVRVYFATNREETRRESPGEKFNYVISDKLTYGYCEVSIPPNNAIGVIKTPSVFDWSGTPPSEKYMILLPPHLYTGFDEFSANLDDVNNLFIFIHGYNVGFGDAARRTAQMARDLRFNGKAIFFSWPSKNNLIRYYGDKKAAKITRPFLKKFLSDLAERFPTKNFYLVAHSMGTELLSKTVIELTEKNSPFKDRVKAVVLAAPDINMDKFKKKVIPAYITMNAPVTVYTSTRDRALMLSGWLQGPRAGRNIFGDKYMEIIDASKVDNDLIGHSYYGGNGDVLFDIDSFIRIPAKADERKWLQRTEVESNPVWILPRCISTHVRYKCVK